MASIVSYTVSSTTIINILPVISQNDIRHKTTSANDKHYIKPVISIQDMLTPHQPKGDYISIETAQKMINCLLIEKKFSKTKLANALEITTDNLDLFFHRKKNALVLIPKINLPLIKLYCATNFSARRLAPTYGTRYTCRYAYDNPNSCYPKQM